MMELINFIVIATIKHRKPQNLLYLTEFQSVGQSRKKSQSEGIRMPRLKVSQKRETFRERKLAECEEKSIGGAGGY